MTEKVQTVCIIGTGLIGGSLALALKKSGFCQRVVGAGRTEVTLKKALDLNIIDHYEMDFSLAVKDADIVVVAVPLSAMKNIFEKIAPALSSTAIVTDAGSAKQSVIKDAEAVFSNNANRFVAGHPISGTEKSGVTAAFVELYNNRKVILTPTDETDDDAVKLVTEMWQAAGAEVVSMSAQHHDMVLAGTSHLPHILAFGLVDCLNNLEEVDEIFRFAAGGFRDFTRIASSDPKMWRDICLSNREDILGMMKKYEDQLQMITSALKGNDGDALIEIFERAKKARDQFNNQ